ncbi:MAG: hypothetical protein ACE367_10615 [Acidimicrobiales bacterium]
MDTGADIEPVDGPDEVREDCRHYSSRTLPTGETVQRCRLGANTEAPFTCPVDCLFFEPRAISDTGWRT